MFLKMNPLGVCCKTAVHDWLRDKTKPCTMYRVAHMNRVTFNSFQIDNFEDIGFK